MASRQIKALSEQLVNPLEDLAGPQWVHRSLTCSKAHCRALFLRKKKASQAIKRSHAVLSESLRHDRIETW